MKQLTRNNIVKRIEEFKQYLFVDEWNAILDFLDTFVEDKPETHRRKEYVNNDGFLDKEAPLVRMLNSLFTTKVNSPLILYVAVFIAGILIGVYGL